MAAPWRAILEKALPGGNDWVLMQLATVKRDGKPSNRTIVFRGFLPGTDSILFFGDRRTRKVEEIAANPWGEVVFWLPGSGHQFRVLGQLRVVTCEGTDEALQKARAEAWAAMDNSDPGRQHPNWPHPRTAPLEEASMFQKQETNAAEVAENFILVYLEPEEVDHYPMADNQRMIYTRQEGTDGVSWAVEVVNP